MPIAWRLHGWLRASKAQERKSSRQIFALAMTSASKRPRSTASASRAIARAIDISSAPPARIVMAIAFPFGRSRVSAAHFDAGPFLQHLRDRGEVGCRAKLGVGDGQRLPDRRAGDHRHAHRLGFVDAEPYVLVGEAGGEPEI